MCNSSFDSVALKLCDQPLDTQAVPNNDRGNDTMYVIGIDH